MKLIKDITYVNEVIYKVMLQLSRRLIQTNLELLEAIES